MLLPVAFTMCRRPFLPPRLHHLEQLCRADLRGIGLTLGSPRIRDKRKMQGARESPSRGCVYLPRRLSCRSGSARPSPPQRARGQARLSWSRRGWHQTCCFLRVLSARSLHPRSCRRGRVPGISTDSEGASIVGGTHLDEEVEPRDGHVQAVGQDGGVRGDHRVQLRHIRHPLAPAVHLRSPGHRRRTGRLGSRNPRCRLPAAMATSAVQDASNAVQQRIFSSEEIRSHRGCHERISPRAPRQKPIGRHEGPGYYSPSVDEGSRGPEESISFGSCHGECRTRGSFAHLPTSPARSDKPRLSWRPTLRPQSAGSEGSPIKSLPGDEHRILPRSPRDGARPSKSYGA